MKKLLIAAAALVMAVVAPLSAQDPSRLYSVPAFPPKDALDRLRLTTSWTFAVPTDGRRDGLYSVQLAPRGQAQELLVQTRSGGVMSIDAASGRLRWSTRVGVPYRVAQSLAYNRDSVFVTNNIELYCLDRDTGRLQWVYDMPEGATAPPAADDEQVYLSLSNGRFVAYALPNLALWAKLSREGKVPGAMTGLESARVKKGIDLPAIGPLSGAREAYRAPPLGPQPTERFSYVPDERIEGSPLQAEDRVLLPGVTGQVVGVTKSLGRTAWELRARGQIRVPAGQHDETAYVACDDFNVYAVSIVSGRVFWRYAAGGQPSDRPAVLDDDVYLPLGQSRLVRLRRADGEELWRNQDGARFLAANKKFVYAADPIGRLLVIDRDRGTTLSTYDGTRDFVFPVRNELTDRIYLAANNGQIVCLHDRDSARPLVMKTVKERAPLPRPAAGGKPIGDGAKPMPMGDGAKPMPVPPMGDGVKPKADEMKQ
jgi:outer membrane protein assembly factor BamB